MDLFGHRRFARGVNLVACCPTMDLVAVVTSDDRLALHRTMKWQALFDEARGGLGEESPSSPSAAKTTAMAWRSDGRVLAVGKADGAVFLIGIASGRPQILPQAPASGRHAQHRSAITHICWQRHEGTASVEGADRASTLLTPPAPFGPSGGGGGRAVPEHKTDCGALEPMEVLVVGDANGVVSLSLSGFYPCGTWREAEGSGLVEGLALASDMGALLVRISPHIRSSSSSSSLVRVDTSALAVHSMQLRTLAHQCGHIDEMIRHMCVSVRMMSRAWRSGVVPFEREFADFRDLIERSSDGRGDPAHRRTPQQQLLAVYLGGIHASPATEQWLTSSSTLKARRRGLQKACATVARLLREHLSPSVTAIVFRLGELRGLARWEAQYGAVGWQSSALDGLLLTVEEVALCAESLQGRLLEAAADWLALFDWMRHVRRVALDAGGDEGEDPSVAAESLPSDTAMARVRDLLAQPEDGVKAGHGLLHSAISMHLKGESDAARGGRGRRGGSGRPRSGRHSRSPPPTSQRSGGRSSSASASGRHSRSGQPLQHRATPLGSSSSGGGIGSGGGGGGTTTMPLGAQADSSRGRTGRFTAGSRYNSSFPNMRRDSRGSTSVSPIFGGGAFGPAGGSSLRRNSGSGGGASGGSGKKPLSRARSRSPFGSERGQSPDGVDSGDGFTRTASPGLLSLAELSPLAMRSARNSGLPLKQQVHQLRVAWAEMRHTPGRYVSKGMRSSTLSAPPGVMAALASLDVDWNGAEVAVEEEEAAADNVEGMEADEEAAEEEEEEEEEMSLMDTARGRAQLAQAIEKVMQSRSGGADAIVARNRLISPKFRQILIALHDPLSASAAEEEEEEEEEMPSVWILRRCVAAQDEVWQASCVRLSLSGGDDDTQRSGRRARLTSMEWYGSDAGAALAVLWTTSAAAAAVRDETYGGVDADADAMDDLRLSVFDLELLPAVTVPNFMRGGGSDDAPSIIAQLNRVLVRLKSPLLFLALSRTLDLPFVLRASSPFVLQEETSEASVTVLEPMKEHTLKSC